MFGCVYKVVYGGKNTGYLCKLLFQLYTDNGYRCNQFGTNMTGMIDDRALDKIVFFVADDKICPSEDNFLTFIQILEKCLQTIGMKSKTFQKWTQHFSDDFLIELITHTVMSI